MPNTHQKTIIIVRQTTRLILNYLISGFARQSKLLDYALHNMVKRLTQASMHIIQTIAHINSLVRRGIHVLAHQQLRSRISATSRAHMGLTVSERVIVIWKKVTSRRIWLHLAKSKSKNKIKNKKNKIKNRLTHRDRHTR